MKKLLLATLAAVTLASTTAYARPLTSIEKLSYTATALTMCKSNRITVVNSATASPSR